MASSTSVCAVCARPSLRPFVFLFVKMCADTVQRLCVPCVCVVEQVSCTVQSSPSAWSASIYGRGACVSLWLA
jgi:hypothetical protein